MVLTERLINIFIPNNLGLKIGRFTMETYWSEES